MEPIEAAGAAFRRLEGAYALAMIFAGHPELIVGAQHGAPLAVGFGEDEMFVGSDALALAPLTRRIAYLQRRRLDRGGPAAARGSSTSTAAEVEREVKLTRLTGAAIGKGNFRHFMEKELHEHPAVIGDTLHRMVNPATRAVALPDLPFDFATRAAHHHQRLRQRVLRRPGRALVVRGDRPHPDRRRCRQRVPLPHAADAEGRRSACWCRSRARPPTRWRRCATCASRASTCCRSLNVPESSMARESDAVLETVAGPEIGVASTKAFTAQLVGAGLSGAGGRRARAARSTRRRKRR